MPFEGYSHKIGTVETGARPESQEKERPAFVAALERVPTDLSRWLQGLSGEEQHLIDKYIFNMGDVSPLDLQDLSPEQGRDTRQSIEAFLAGSDAERPKVGKDIALTIRRYADDAWDNKKEAA